MPNLYWCPHRVLKATGAPVIHRYISPLSQTNYFKGLILFAGAIQPDERRMLETVFKILQGNYDDEKTSADGSGGNSQKPPGKLNKLMVLSNSSNNPGQD